MARKNIHHEAIDTHWLKEHWRPYMAMLYMAICGFDFIVFPMLWSLVQLYGNGTISAQWQPLSLQGGGFIHIAFGAVLGISAYGRTQEKLAGVSTTPFPIAPSTIPEPNQDLSTDSSTPSVEVNDKGQKVIPQSSQPEL